MLCSTIVSLQVAIDITGQSIIISQTIYYPNMPIHFTHTDLDKLLLILLIIRPPQGADSQFNFIGFH